MAKEGTLPYPWVRTADRLPTREDANKAEDVLVYSTSDKDVYARCWGAVGRFKDQLSYWRPMPLPPPEEPANKNEDPPDPHGIPCGCKGEADVYCLLDLSNNGYIAWVECASCGTYTKEHWGRSEDQAMINAIKTWMRATSRQEKRE